MGAGKVVRNPAFRYPTEHNSGMSKDDPLRGSFALLGSLFVVPSKGVDQDRDRIVRRSDILARNRSESIPVKSGYRPESSTAQYIAFSSFPRLISFAS